MSELKAAGLTLDVKARTLTREGRSIKLTATQADLLVWLDDTTEPNLTYCCADLWERVEPDYVRGLWGRLASLMTKLGVAPLIDEQDGIALHHVDEDGCPYAPVAPAPEIFATSDEAAEMSGDPLVSRTPLPIAPEITASLDREVGELRAEVGRLEAELEAARIKAKKELDDAEHQILLMRAGGSRLGLLIEQARDANTARERAEAELGHVRASLAAANDRNAELAARIEEGLKARLKAEREAAAAPQEPARDTPLALAPRHVTIPVSETLYRWLEGVALRNRCSPENVVSKFILAMRRAAEYDARRAA